ncbi:GntR family transcriptional regulator [Oculatella sp. LEGE 06141]|uniref:GntR family transcriptional regulator n=1 Tax=Oculatella sp. LEGE 06141 TaxID=1828648 RepID=UPI0018817F8B|nr:GntR family transcriptional regulator [Oculatella sp. LEGE 06141]MBE9181167.1 GntR family transcriptional regulator [Oculatella sp. LEGE 06141]
MVLSDKHVQRNKSLHEQTYQALRDSILAGELAPGDRLIELQLAEQLKVSRTPIREAIRQLQREELVTADDIGWLRVTTLSSVEAANLYDCRIALETLSTTGACENISPAQLKKLKDYVTKAEKLSKRKLTKQVSQELLEVDYQFHCLIAQSSGNRCLVSLLDQVFGKMALLRAQTTQHNPNVLDVRVEHQQIYEAIAHRDARAATQEIQHHLSASKARVLQELESLKHHAEALP